MISTPGDVGRGLQHLGHPRVWGAVIGAVGGSVFVHANRDDLPAAVSVGALVVWACALAVFVWGVLITPRLFVPPGPLPRSAGWVYFGSVAGMLLGIQLGRLALEAVERVDVLPCVIVLAVGLHFLPFARAFDTRMFTRLGLLMAVLGVAGLVLGLLWTGTAAAAAAVVTGVVMLLVISQDALSGRPGLVRGRAFVRR